MARENKQTKHLFNRRLSILISMMATVFITGMTLPSCGQNGSSRNPFTALAQASNVNGAGIYYFNLGGATFSTYVNETGYVQIAIDFGNGTGNLPAGTSLTTNSRGILNATVLAALNPIEKISISSSSGNVDVTTSNATIISRVQNNQPIHKGTADNGINDSWAGTNAIYFTVNASCTNTANYLYQNIIHICGNGSGFHWVPNSNNQTEQWSSGEVSDATSFHLWVKGAQNLLPIELLNFNAGFIRNGRVKLTWETASENNNDYFTVERSKDGNQWEETGRINGAGNSSQLSSYSFTDFRPLPDISYYRLKQTDFNGQFTHSEISMIIAENIEISKPSFYPNPANNTITIEGNTAEIASIKIYTIQGLDVTDATHLLYQGESIMAVDISKLEPGQYLVKSSSGVRLLIKK